MHHVRGVAAGRINAPSALKTNGPHIQALCIGEKNITYVREGWDLYIGQFLMQVREYRDNINCNRELVETTHHIESVLFQAKSPERSLEWALEFMANHSDADHDGKYDLREFECIGIYDLDNTQSSVTKITDEITSDIGFSIDCIGIENVDINKFIGEPSRERLKLFQHEQKNT